MRSSKKISFVVVLLACACGGGAKKAPARAAPDPFANLANAADATLTAFSGADEVPPRAGLTELKSLCDEHRKVSNLELASKFEHVGPLCEAGSAVTTFLATPAPERAKGAPQTRDYAQALAAYEARAGSLGKQLASELNAFELAFWRASSIRVQLIAIEPKSAVPAPRIGVAQPKAAASTGEPTASATTPRSTRADCLRQCVGKCSDDPNCEQACAAGCPSP